MMMMMSPQTIATSLHGLLEIDQGTGCDGSRKCNEEGGPNPVIGGEMMKVEQNKRQKTLGRSNDCPPGFLKSKHSKGPCPRRLPSRHDNDDDPTRGGIMAVSTSTATTTTTTDHHHHHDLHRPKDSLQRQMTLWTNLLSQRPIHPANNEETMSRWLMNVLQ